MLGALSLGGFEAACNGAVVPPQPPEQPPEPPDLKIGALTDLLTVVHLRWLLLVQPRRLRSITWLQTSLGQVLRDERLELLARMTGVDLRTASKLVLAGYRGGSDAADDTIAYFVRHSSSPLAIERKFRERLTSATRRTAHGHQLVSAWGNIGMTPHGFVSIGPDVAGFQYGGSRRRGPGRIALLYAQGKLSDVNTALADPTLGALHAALGGGSSGLDRAAPAPPLEFLMPGPFEGEVARGARGLLAAASGMGAAMAPTERQSLRLTLLVAGDYGSGSDREQARRLFALAWSDLATSDLGHLLGLHQPVTPASSLDTPLGLGMHVELDARTLFDGLAAATVASIREIMR